jgi:hypothetical protein
MQLRFAKPFIVGAIGLALGLLAVPLVQLVSISGPMWLMIVPEAVAMTTVLSVAWVLHRGGGLLQSSGSKAGFLLMVVVGASIAMLARFDMRDEISNWFVVATTMSDLAQIGECSPEALGAKIGRLPAHWAIERTESGDQQLKITFRPDESRRAVALHQWVQIGHVWPKPFHRWVRAMFYARTPLKYVAASACREP